MNAMYFGTVGELKSVRASGDFEKFLVNRYAPEFGKPSEALVNSWLNSTGYLLDLMSGPNSTLCPRCLSFGSGSGRSAWIWCCWAERKQNPKH